MKKKIICLLPLICLPFALSSCTKEHVVLTYGTYIESTIQTLKEIDSDELDNRLSKGENLLLAAYQGQYSDECLCWDTFKNVIVNYINTYHEEVFLYNAQEQSETISKYKIQKFSESTPILYIFKGYKQIASFSESKKQDKSIFNEKNAKAMYNRVHQFVEKPTMYYVDDDYLQSNLAEQFESILLFIRNSCGDCKYLIPNAIIPYINVCRNQIDIWLFDLEPYRELQKVAEDGSTPYDDIKNKYLLSESANPQHGYQQGVVPTMQYYQSGKLKDATVYFNDVVSQNAEGKYYISDSFYTQERLSHTKYDKQMLNNVLKGMELSDDDVAFTSNGDPYWIQEKAAMYHTPLLHAFLDKYSRN